MMNAGDLSSWFGSAHLKLSAAHFIDGLKEEIIDLTWSEEI